MKDFLKEMIPVILGILIALLINSWWQGRTDRKYLRTVTDTITAELKENKQYLTGAIAQKRGLIDTLSSYAFDDTVTIGEIIGKNDGMRSAQIKNTGWLSLINANLKLVDGATISVLTDINENKSNLKTRQEKVIEFLYQNASSSISDDKQVFSLILNDLIYIEEELLEDHETFLKSVGDR